MTFGFSLTWPASVRCTGWLGRFRETPKKNLRKSQNSSCIHVARGYIAPMNEIAANKIKTLLEIKTANYRATGDSHPEVAAQFAVEAIVRMVMGQPKHIQQLLDEEIEDALKAGRAAA